MIYLLLFIYILIYLSKKDLLVIIIKEFKIDFLI